MQCFEILEKEKRLKWDRIALDLEKSKTEVRILRDQECKLKNEMSILQERNKMLKSWNEQTLQDKKLLNEAIEKIRYEKFHLMKKIDEEFEVTKQKNERLLEDIELLENEKNILQEGVNSVTEELELFKTKGAQLAQELHAKEESLRNLQERNETL